MSLRTLRMYLGCALLAGMAMTVVSRPFQARAQDEIASRKIKSKVAPMYPEIARRMAIAGKVKLAVVVSANGRLKTPKSLAAIPFWSMPPWTQ